MQGDFGVVYTLADLGVVIAAGGTGGHLYPAIAIADAIRALAPMARIHFLGARGRLEEQVLPRRGYAVWLLDVERLRGGGMRQAMRGVLRLPVAVGRAVGHLRDFGPSLVIGAGGFASGAGVVAASLLGIPRVIHEQNAVPGLTNRVSGRLAQRVYTSFEGGEAWFPPSRVRLVGNPVRADIAEVRSHALWGNASSALRVLVLGGSQGARFLNERVPEAIAHLRARRVAVDVWHQAGASDAQDTLERYAAVGASARVEPFIEDMARAYAWADVAICRSGASTVAELAAASVPALLVPFPFAAGDHQAANADVLVRAGGAAMLRQDAWDGERTALWLEALAKDRERLHRMAERAHSEARAHAARDIAQDALDLALRARGGDGR
jgi:UDP-N-acetylglucosamine--N-acetylmuramyl-(pentapeptide) pyrophosphoryl-undecaprenol N-acetylglucosamine transferase